MRAVLSLGPGRSGRVWLHKPRGRTIAAHHHAELECNLIVQGQAVYVVGERRYALRPGDLIWLFPQQDHVLIEMSADFRMWILVVHPQALRPHCHQEQWSTLLAGDPPGDWCRRLPAPRWQELAELFAQFDGDADPVVGNVVVLHATVASWDAFLQAGPVGTATALPKLVATAVSHLLAKDWPDLDELAQVCGVSYSQLSRVFKAAMGQTLVPFRNHCRLQRLFDNLDGDDDQTLTARALAVGFGSYAQFHRVCVEQLGCSPRAYLKSLQRS